MRIRFACYDGKDLGYALSGGRAQFVLIQVISGGKYDL
jgi:hypothetical protein